VTTTRVPDRSERDSGASAVEYGLLVAAIAAVIVLVVLALGQVTKKPFDETCEAIKSSSTAPVNSAADCP
jgi:pilus assembly protein Flp/PilA